MWDLKLLFLIIFIGYVAGEVKLEACKKDDLKCLTTLVRQIVQGFPEYNIPTVDPFHLPEETIHSEHVLIKLSKVNITGLAKQTIDEFKFYPDGKTVKFTFTTPFEIKAEMTLNSETPTEGIYHLKGTVTGHSQYTFKVLRASDFEYYDIVPTAIEGHAQHKPEAKLSFPRKLRGSHSNVADDLWRKHKDEINTLVLETMLQKAYAALMNNLIAITKTLPKTRFLIDF